jgi:hypothetical protein
MILGLPCQLDMIGQLGRSLECQEETFKPSGMVHPARATTINSLP